MRIDDKLVFMERRVVVQVKNYATGATCGMGALHKHFRGGLKTDTSDVRTKIYATYI